MLSISKSPRVCAADFVKMVPGPASSPVSNADPPYALSVKLVVDPVVYAIATLPPPPPPPSLEPLTGVPPLALTEPVPSRPPVVRLIPPPEPAPPSYVPSLFPPLAVIEPLIVVLPVTLRIARPPPEPPVITEPFPPEEPSSSGLVVEPYAAPP